MKKLFFVRSGSTCRMLRILAAAMLLLPVNLQPVRASRQDAGAKSSLTVKMKDATLSSVFAEVERTSRYAFIYHHDYIDGQGEHGQGRGHVLALAHIPFFARFAEAFRCGLFGFVAHGNSLLSCSKSALIPSNKSVAFDSSIMK